MKKVNTFKVVVLILTILIIAISASAQKIITTTYTKSTEIYQDSISLVKNAVLTPEYATDSQGRKYNIYKGSRGGLFIVAKRSTGKYYKKYIKK